MAVINISQKTEFEDTISSNDLVVHFYADWTTQCGPTNDVLEELAKQAELKAVRFAKCPAEDLPEVSLKYSISAVPTFLLLRGGSLLHRIDGANAAELTKKINLQVSKVSNVVSPPPAKAIAEDLVTRLRGLINSSPVTLFMKRTAADHKCGFSKSMVALLDSHGAAYKTFDILTDEEVRQGLKTYSKWPTYPQLYVNGELIGGLDIVKEMNESGELQALLPKKEPLETRLKSLINQSTCMVFMKGPRDAPCCGFSKQLMAILAETELPIDPSPSPLRSPGPIRKPDEPFNRRRILRSSGSATIKFDTFDILTDEEVRHGLKTFSNWPTYPQVYVKGELIGGLDIIKELKESGELLSALKGEA